MLFPLEAITLKERLHARKDTIDERVAMRCAASITPIDRPFVWWCDLNAESDALTRAIPGAVEYRGSDTEETRDAGCSTSSTGVSGSSSVNRPSAVSA